MNEQIAIEARNPAKPHRSARLAIALALLWVSAVAAQAASLATGQPPASLVATIGFAAVGFIILLIWRLAHSLPPSASLPSLAPLVLPGAGFYTMLWSIIVALVALFVIGIAQHPWVIVLSACSVAALRLIVAWRRQISQRLVTLGIAAGLIAALASAPVTQSGLLGVSFTLVTTPLLFIGGALLVEHTGLARIRLLEGGYRAGLGSFAWATMLALPGALLNILGGASASDRWVLRWWHPLAALAPSIAEETAARLFLTTLCYALLRPTTNDRPRRAIAAAILIGATTHSLAHLPTLSMLSMQGVTFLIAGLLYGVPMALLFVKRDFEQAVGYHFCIDFVRFLAALVHL